MRSVKNVRPQEAPPSETAREETPCIGSSTRAPRAGRSSPRSSRRRSSSPVQPSARVTSFVIDSTTPLTGQNIPYQQLRGRAFGVLDPNDSHNAIITDIQLGKDPDGMVRYETTFTLTSPGRHVAGIGLPVARRAEPRRRHHDRRRRAELRRHRPRERLAGRQRRRDRGPGEPRDRDATTGSRCRMRRMRTAPPITGQRPRPHRESDRRPASEPLLRDGQSGPVPAGVARHDAGAC